MTVIRWYARALLGLLVAQFYAAGAALFGVTGFEAHAVIGWSMIPLVIVLVILVVLAGAAGKRGPLLMASTSALALAASQPVLVFWARPNVPALAALHPVVALAMLCLLLLVERRAADAAATRGMVDAFGRSPRRST